MDIIPSNPPPAQHCYHIRIAERHILPGVRASLYLRSEDFTEACWEAIAETYGEARQLAERQRALLEGSELL